MRFLGFVFFIWALAVALAQRPEITRPVREILDGLFGLGVPWVPGWALVFEALRAGRW